MFKICVRSIINGSNFKQNLILHVNAFLINQHNSRVYTKPKKTKKMLRFWEITNEANEYQNELRQQQQAEKPQPQTTGRDQFKSSAPPTRQYRLVSYNILAQDLLTEHFHLYYDINTQYLRWEHRLRNLRNELLAHNADILCIQEMQFNHLKEFVAFLSETRRMEYVYKKKTGHRTDGCAIIYDRDLFQLLDQQDLELYQPQIDNKLNRENVAIFAKFKLRHEPNKEIVIATTHLLYNPRRHDVRVSQANFLLKNLKIFASKPQNNKYVPVILTGDMNSEPNSPPFNKLTAIVEDDLAVDEQQQRDTKLQTTDESGNQQLPTIFSLKAINFGNECASTQHDRWITVDYILRSIEMQDNEHFRGGNAAVKSDVKILRFYRLPSVSNCLRNGKIPNEFLGSDHYLQAIEFMVA